MPRFKEVGCGSVGQGVSGILEAQGRLASNKIRSNFIGSGEQIEGTLERSGLTERAKMAQRKEKRASERDFYMIGF
jgi:hypothetical protein